MNEQIFPAYEKALTEPMANQPFWLSGVIITTKIMSNDELETRV